MTIRPLIARVDNATFEELPLCCDDGTQLGLTRIIRNNDAKAAVLLTHGLTASSDMFVLPETRNMIDVLLDNGYEAWLLDWRGSCRLPYNEFGPSYTLDDVALYDIPTAVRTVRNRIGDRKLFVIAHCVSALACSLSMAAGLVPNLAGVVAQGVFLTPKLSLNSRMRLTFMGEFAHQLLGSTIPTDIRKVGLWSRFTPVFAMASIGAACPDPTCQILHNSAWGMGASLFEHDNLHPITHDRLAELLGTVPTRILSHFRKLALAQSVVSWHEGDPRYAALPSNALDEADRIDCPILLVRGSENKLWLDSNRLCMNVLSSRYPDLDVQYIEVPAYGHFDAFVGRNAAIDVFPYITDWLEERL